MKITGVALDDRTYKVSVENTKTDGKNYCYYIDIYADGRFAYKSGYKVLTPNEKETVRITTMVRIDGVKIEFRLRAVEKKYSWTICSLLSGYTTVDTYTVTPSVEKPIIGCTGHGLILDVDIESNSDIIGKAEVKFHARISNDGTCGKYFRCKLYSQHDRLIDTEPDINFPYIRSGEIKTITLSSIGKLWSAGTIPTTEVPYIVLEERTALIAPWETLADNRHIQGWKSYTYEPPKSPFEYAEEKSEELFDFIGIVAPTLNMPGIAFINTPVSITGKYEPNKTLKLYIDKKQAVDKLIKDDIITDYEGRYDAEYQFNKSGIYKLYVDEGLLPPSSERSTIIIIGIEHVVLLIVAMAMIVYRLRRK